MYFLIIPYVNTETMSIVLEAISSRHSEEFFMFMDQAGCHKDRKIKLPENIKFSWLHPRSF
jgi:hypothetical protein